MVLISILIPVHNWRIAPLFERLVDEIDGASLGQLLEIIIIDDASSDIAIKEENAGWVSRANHTGVRYTELLENKGRATVRNLLAEKASGRYLLFLDADVLPDAPDFLRNYIKLIENADYDVICGGVSYTQRVFEDSAFDFYVYFHSRTSAKPAAIRNIHPWRFVLTSNILVAGAVFKQIPFDERFIGYGYEDNEWGIRLGEKCRLIHTENPVSHLGLKRKELLFREVESSMKNFLLLSQIHPAFFRQAPIWKWVQFLSCFNVGLIQALASVAGQALLLNRKSNRLNLLLLQFCKAAFFTLEQKRNKAVALSAR